MHGFNTLKYNNALKERNLLLKDNCTDESWYSSVEKQMVKFGYEIEEARRKTIEMLNFEISDRKMGFFHSNIFLISEKIMSEQTFEKSLFENRKKEFFVGRTLVGPHKSDFEVVLEEKNMNAKKCSTGEQKALLISILSSTVRAHLRNFNIAPILLLDEISAHLDEKTRGLFFDELLSLKVQAFLTGTEKNFFNQLSGKCQTFEIYQKDNESSIEEYSFF